MDPKDQGPSTWANLSAHLLVGVIRSPTRERAAALSEGVFAGGFDALEITATTPGVFDLIRAFSEPGRILGVGTVTSREHVERAADAGARFIVSPHTDPDLIAKAHEAGMLAIPGAMTPTEILNARRAGADAVKVFPISAVGGPGFVRWFRGPLPDIPLWVSGNVTLDEIPAYVDSGVSLIGLTSALTGHSGPDVREQARARAARALEARDTARSKQPLLTVVTPKTQITVDLSDIRDLPSEDHCALDTVMAGRHGEAARIGRLLGVDGFPKDGRLRLTSTDGFAREVAVDEVMTRGYVHYATDGAPLTPAEGGPLRLYLRGPGDQCDNVKRLCRIEVIAS